MKHLYRILVIALLFAGFTSCNDDDNFAIQSPVADFNIETPLSGNRVVLDGTNPDNVALTITWNDPKNDGQSLSYNVEVAELNSDFAIPMIAGTTNSNNIQFTVAQLNAFLLDTVRVNPNVEMAYDLRVVASNGDISNAITVVFTPFIVEVSQLFVNLGSTNFDPSQAIPMGMLDVNKFEKVVSLADGDSFNFTESNTSDAIVWQQTEAGSNMVTKYGGVNFSGYEAGAYRLTVDLNNFSIEIVQILQPKLAVPGNHQGWDPPTAPLLAASSATTTDYEGYIWLDGGHKFVAPDNDGNFNWGNIDWGDNGSFSGVLAVDGESNCEASAGYYFIKVDTQTLTYSEVMYNWGLIGNATGSWDFDQNMTYDQASKKWSITMDLVVGELKFRANDGWDWNYGDDGGDGTLENGSANIVVSAAGNYTIILDLSNPRAYTYSLNLN